jgi:RimJ/RimL family protein N-acetyltransferase
MAAGTTIRRATQDDLAFVMATERLDGYEELVGRWDENRHRLALCDERHAYFLAEMGGARVGFAILRDWGAPATLIQRVALAVTGQGIGTALTRALIDAVFSETEAHRLTIGTFPENLRARRAYEKAGFVAEGIARASVFFAGRYRDELVLSILRPEWQAGRSGLVKPAPGL